MKKNSRNFQPLVSIIIPSFNQGHFLDETIQSILLQHYRPIEIIIIDAVSLDNTLDILHKYDNTEEIKWLSEPDSGHADGINKGISISTGEIVAWLNADDVYFSKNVIGIVVEYFADHPEVDVVYGDVAVISSKSTLLRMYFLPQYRKGRILRQNMVSQPAVFMQKHVVENEKLEIGQIGLDYEYWLRLINKGYSFFHVNKILACDRHYQERISVTKKDMIENQIHLVKTKLGIYQTSNLLIYAIDRCFQAICRIRGLIFLLCTPDLKNNYEIAFPIQIDSFRKLLWRQMTKSIGSDFSLE